MDSRSWGSVGCCRGRLQKKPCRLWPHPRKNIMYLGQLLLQVSSSGWERLQQLEWLRWPLEWLGSFSYFHTLSMSFSHRSAGGSDTGSLMLNIKHPRWTLVMMGKNAPSLVFQFQPTTDQSSRNAAGSASLESCLKMLGECCQTQLWVIYKGNRAPCPSPERPCGGSGWLYSKWRKEVFSCYGWHTQLI